MNQRVLLRAITDIGIFAIAAGGCYLALSFDRPITAVLVFLTGLIAIAVHSGLRSALVAAVGASLVYNFLNGPQFQFGVDSSDELVPLLAFVSCAVISGIIVGRLKDAAERAQIAQTHTEFLLRVSERLQGAISIDQIEQVTRDVLPDQIASGVELYLLRGDVYVRPATGEEVDDSLGRQGNDDHGNATTPRAVFFDLEGSNGELGIVKFQVPQPVDGRIVGAKHGTISSLRAISALLALAIERCMLLETVAEAQASRRSEELKDTLLSSVSHDLRTPLTAIKAAAGALASQQVSLKPADRDALLVSIVEQCRRLDRYTSELLDVGNIQAGISSSRFDQVELTEIVQTAINHAKLAYPGMLIERQLPSAPVLVMANALMLEQALLNILENACKFGGDSGPVRVDMTSRHQTATITISDDGPGIAPSDVPHLFTRFFRGDTTRMRVGSGLGLYIAKGFIDAFDGSIDVESANTTERGAKFAITIPTIAGSPNLKVVA